MWGAIIGAAASLASSGIGALQSAKAGRANRKLIQDQLRANQDWYNRRWNEDATQRADAQTLLTRLSDSIRRRNRAAAGAAAVTGGTTEAAAAEKEANAKAMSDAIAQVAAQGEARKDDIERQYQTTKAGLTGQLANIEQQRAANIAGATKAANEAAGTLGASADDWLDELKKAAEKGAADGTN